MGKRKRHNNRNISKKSKSFELIDDEIKHLEVQKAVLLDEGLNSNDPDKLIKASTYLKSIDKDKKKQNGELKTYIYSPEEEFFTGLGFKGTTKSVTYDLLRKMGNTPVVNSVITTRIEQILNFSQFTLDDQKEGWTIRKKLGRFEKYEGAYENTDEDKRNIDYLSDFLQNGGEGKKWDLEDDFEDYIRKGTKDTLELDQLCVEFERNKLDKLLGFLTVDSGTMRKLETLDPKNVDKYNYDLKYGYKPIYTQVYNNRILTHWETKQPIVYYPWELSFVIRNKTSNLRNNGYGRSELEILTEIITWMLWGMQYNGNFFKQGSNPKGFFSIEGNVNQNMLAEFRSAWRQTVMGVMNAHKVPVFEGNKIAWNDMHHNNKDMEFQNWNEFLILNTCSVYRIDPSELGFNFKQGQQMFGQQGQKERIEHSMDKGLKPLLKMHQKHINKYIISELSNDRYEFVWTGIDLEDEEMRIKNVNDALAAGITSFEKQFEAFEGEPYNEKKHTILNPVFQQVQQAKLYGGQDMNQVVDQETGEPEAGAQNPFDQYEKSLNDNPILRATQEYITKSFSND